MKALLHNDSKRERDQKRSRGLLETSYSKSAKKNQGGGGWRGIIHLTESVREAVMYKLQKNKRFSFLNGGLGEERNEPVKSGER